MKHKPQIITIIVPVYNIERYIEKCIKSIINQTFQDFELLLVNDGSTDNSMNVINKYRNYKNIKILNKENGGLSSARNYGIRNSTGDYIMFVDGDDFLYDKYSLEKINASIQKEKTDIIQYKMVQYFDKTNKYVYSNNLINDKKNAKLEIIENLNRKGQVSVSACEKIIKRSVIIDNDLYFADGMLSEDILWSLKLYIVADTITLLNENIYVYRQQRDGSISSSKSNKLCSDLFYIIKYWINYDYTSERVKQIYLNIIAYWYLILRVKFDKKNYTKEMIDFFKKNDKRIICYNNNYKVKKAYMLQKIFGLKFTILAMRFYLYMKNKGLIKI